jgi:hypothetical protein
MQNYGVLYSEQFRCKIRETAKGCPMRVLRKTVFLLLILPWLANAQSNLSVLSLNNIQFADQQTGTDACAKIRSAIAALPVNGGEVDARGLLGFQTCSVNPFANILSHPGESVHLYLAAGSTFTTSVQWMIPLGSIVTGGGSAPGGGRGTTLMASSAFLTGTPVVYLGDVGQSEGPLIENITIDCNHVAGSIGIFSDRVQELGGARNVSVINYRAVGIQMLDQANLSPGTGGLPENYILDELQLGGDANSTCIEIRVGAGGQRGGAHITCSSSLVEQFSLSCSAGIVTATFIPPPGVTPTPVNTIPNGSSIGVESGPKPSLDGLFTVTSKSDTQLQWSQPGCSGTSSGVVVGVMAQNGVQLDGSDGVYSQIHCEFTVDCVLIDSDPLQNGWVTRALTVSGVTGQSSVKDIVHLGSATHPEDIMLTALQRCGGPNPATQGCATNVLLDDFAGITLQENSLAWYLIGHSSSGAQPALLSSSPSVNWFMPNPFLVFRNGSFFSQLGGQTNGTFTYCSDCTVTTPSSCSTANPSACVCSGGGAGAFAKRLNGAWFCN